MKQNTPAEIKPRPNRETPANRLRWPLGLFVVVFVLAAATIWPVLNDPDQVLAFNDGSIECMLSPTYHIPEIMVRAWDNQFFFGSGSGQAPLTITNLGESIGAAFWRRWGQAWITALCALGIYWTLRQYRIHPYPAALSASIMVFAGWPFNSALTGLAVRMIALSCSAVALGFVERGRITRQWLPYAIGGGFLGLAVAEVPDVGLLFALATAAVFLWTHLSERMTPTDVVPVAGTTSSMKSRVHDPKGPKICNLCSVVCKFALYVACSLLISCQTISFMFATQIQGVTQGSSESPEQRYNWATQWSSPPAELWNTVSGSYFGTSINSPTKPYWGREGRDPNWETTNKGFRNFTLTGTHIGVIPCALMLALIGLAIRTSWNRSSKSFLLPTAPWLWLIVIGAGVCMMLMWGRFFFLYKLFWSLPYMSTFRCADKWQGPFLLFIGLATAIVLDAAWKSLKSKDPGTGFLWRNLTISFSVMAVLGLLIAIGTNGNRDLFTNARIAEGYQATASLMWNNAVNASFKVFLLAGLCAFGTWRIGRLNDRDLAPSPVAVFTITGLIALGDLTYDNLPYIQGHKYKHFLESNPLTDYLDAHRTEGRIKLMPAQHGLLNNLHQTQIMLKGYDLFDPVSVSRMPVDYESLFTAFARNQVRLWELGALRYFLTLPGGEQQLNQMDGNRGRFVERLALGVDIVNESYIPVSNAPANQRYLRLVEFTGALPKYRLVDKTICLPDSPAGNEAALHRLASETFDPTREVILQSSQVLDNQFSSSSKAAVEVTSETPTEVHLHIRATQPGYLVRSAKYDPNWKILLNGNSTPLIRANYLFQAVQIPSGSHEVAFSYLPSFKQLKLAASTRILLIAVLACWGLLNVKRRVPGL